ncbi:hypothetical protein JTE90_002170 [Oedothorax gibbosus]|uniref:Elongation of very long chain fatty acids protein n=1 Tax=Oedothorax gibbosus TaxID=931172 RepID=A0AAV6V8T4_9ARAC|nr:hypothetical protein JTE90_002170 [Oedothorax gibbosus]
MEGTYDFRGPRDPKMAEYPLMANITPTVLLSAVYLSIVLYIGPQLMKDRKPFVLRTPMFIYNMLLVGLSSWIVISYVIHGWSWYNFRCHPIDLSESENAVKVTQICWIFFISKLVEFCDTIFFILRKKDNQVNFLHVFHHSTVPITAWYGVNYGPGGYNLIFPTANSFVHMWMYLYYGLSALGPGIQKYLWWKKYLTKLQLAQFIFVTGYFLQLYLFPKENCGVSPFLVWLSLSQAIIYFMLFLHFYIKSYGEKATKNGPKVRNGDSLDHQNGNSRHSVRKIE